MGGMGMIAGSRIRLTATVLIVLVLLAIGGTISLPPLAAIAERVLGTFFLSQAAGVAAVGLGFLLIMLVYVLSQLTTIANRLAVLVQELAIEHARRHDPAGSADEEPPQKKPKS